MKIHPAESQVTLIADSPQEVEFLVALAAVFAEGGSLEANPLISAQQAIRAEQVKQAKPVV